MSTCTLFQLCITIHLHSFERLYYQQCFLSSCVAVINLNSSHSSCVAIFKKVFVALRILEMKQELFKMEILEYSYFDDLLTDMKLTPVRWRSIICTIAMVECVCT